MLIFNYTPTVLAWLLRIIRARGSARLVKRGEFKETGLAEMRGPVIEEMFRAGEKTVVSS